MSVIYIKSSVRYHLCMTGLNVMYSVGRSDMTRLAARDVAGPYLMPEHHAALYHLAGTRPSLLRQAVARWRASGHPRTQVPVVGRVSCCPTRTRITECGHPRWVLESAQASPPHARVLLSTQLGLAGRTSATLPTRSPGLPYERSCP